MGLPTCEALLRSRVDNEPKGCIIAGSLKQFHGQAADKIVASVTEDKNEAERCVIAGSQKQSPEQAANELVASKTKHFGSPKSR